MTAYEVQVHVWVLFMLKSKEYEQESTPPRREERLRGWYWKA